MTQTNRKREPFRVQEKPNVGAYDPFFGSPRRRSLEGQVFSPHFPTCKGMDINSTWRRAASAR